jgi:single-stranded DNA-binding protein
MSAFLLCTGTLLRDPGEKVSKAGKPYASAMLRVGEGDAMLFVNIRVFHDDAAVLLSLVKGDSCSVQGKADIGTYQAKDGQWKPSVSVMCSALTPLRKIKPKQPAAEPARDPDSRSKAERTRGTWSGPADGPSDDIPFGDAR